MHPLLLRQLKRLGLDGASPPPSSESWARVLARVSAYYNEADSGRSLLERSLAISSLEMQELYERLRVAAQSELARERDTFATVIESFGDGLCLLDHDLVIRLVNPAAARLVGREIAQLVNSAVSVLLDPKDPEAAQKTEAAIRTTIMTGKSWSSDQLRFGRRDGSAFPVSLVVNPLTGRDGSPGAVLVFADTTLEHDTARRRLENEAQLRRQNAAMLALSHSVALRTGHLTEALEDITRICAHTLGVERTSIWWRLDDPPRIRCADLFEQTPNRHSCGHELAGETYPGYLNAISGETMVAVDDALTDPRTSELAESYLRPLGIGATLAVPILDGRRVVGVFCSEHSGGARAWTLEDQQFGALAANFVSLAVERANRMAAQQAAESATLAKTQFLANMSHEIRTPMNAVLGLSEVLLESGLDASQREKAQGIYSAARGLLRVINDVLDVSRIEAGRLDLVEGPFDPVAMVQGVCDTLRPLARAKGLTFEWFPERADVTRVVGDEGRIRQILINLVGNAIKFTDEGTVRVGLTLEPRGSGEFHLSVQVVDTGGGIDPSKIETLFQPFVQADASSSRTHSGTGLGLHIARQLAHLMGGEVRVNSRLGAGSTFHFEVPLREAAPDSRIQIPAPVDQAEPPGALRILVAEDNVLNQAVVRAMLESSGHSVVVAEDGIMAVAEFSRGRFDCVLMDWQMPKVDGLEATRRIRAFELGASRPRTPIIGLTANAMAGDRERMIAAGMDGFVAKPFTRIELSRALPQKLAPETASRLEAVVTFEPGLLGEVMALDRFSPGFLKSLIADFLGTTPSLFGQLEEALEAESDEAARASHTLKSTARLLGGGELARLAAESEACVMRGELDRARDLLSAMRGEFSRLSAALTDHMNSLAGLKGERDVSRPG